MDIEITSFTRIFPTTKVERAESVPLSIIETFATHSTAEGVWFYHRPAGTSEFQLLDRLQESFRRTIDVFPQYSGRLVMNKECKPQGGHTERFARLKLVWGTDSDLGAGYVVARAGKKLSDLIPSAEERRKLVGGWDRTELPTTSFLPAKLFRPTLITFLVQVTTFACGGFAIGITTSHSLMDIQSVSFFAQHWASVYNRIFLPEIQTSTLQAPTFNPQLLDNEAAGNINGMERDYELVQKAHSLPKPHYEQGGDKEEVTASTAQGIESISKVFHFTADQSRIIWEAANLHGKSVGRQQALIAHVWSVINRARGFTDDERIMNLGMPFDLRRRFGLPTSFLGSPVIHADIHLSGSQLCTAPLSDVAASIKTTIGEYKLDKLRALLHELAFEENPQRYAAHPGQLPPERGLVITAIPHMNFFKVNFEGMIPELVLPTTVLINGLVVILEARPANGKCQTHWCDDGVDVMVTLEKYTMDNLTGDERLAVPNY